MLNAIVFFSKTSKLENFDDKPQIESKTLFKCDITKILDLKKNIDAFYDVNIYYDTYKFNLNDKLIKFVKYRIKYYKIFVFIPYRSIART